MQTADRLNPGSMREQISWQRRDVVGQGTFGQDVIALVTVVTCKAELNPGQGKELHAAQQIWAEARYVFRQHFYRGLAPEMQIHWYKNGEVRVLDVIDIRESPDGHVQTITAKDHVE